MPFHPIWIAVALVVVLIVFGPRRLPELGGAVGKAMREFRKATSELTNEVTSSTHPNPAPQAPAPLPPPPPAPTGPADSAPGKGLESASSSNP